MTWHKLRLGISHCLLGAPVRFDGGHKRSRYLTDVLGDYVEWVQVCPEIEIGLGAPRESLRLVKGEEGPRLVAPKSGADHTQAMQRYAERRVADLRDSALRGFVLKKDSPTCGMSRVRLYDMNDVPSKDGTGAFARVLVKNYPNLPVEEEGRLNDPRLREHFITRIFAYDRWLRFLAEAPGAGDLVRFHTAQKMLIMAHSPKQYQLLGRLVAEAGKLEPAEWILRYEAGFLGALAIQASPGRHINVLQHLAGFLKRDLDAVDRGDIQGSITEYRKGYVPLVTPLTLLHHHLKRLGHEWVEAQVYLEPYPRELALRSHI